MNNEVWIALGVCALGTFLLRLLPTLWMKRHLQRQQAASADAPMPLWLTVLAPTMIAAMFGVSLIPYQQSLTAWIATLLGIFTTFVVWRRTRSLGWPVCCGVIVFGLVEVAALMFSGF